jgi:hypothetical protein
MKITTISKNYNTISISRVKTHCNISEDDYSFDDIIRLKTYASIDYCENYINSSITPSQKVLEDDSYLYPKPYIYYRIFDSNITVSAITLTDYTGKTTVVPPSQYKVENYSNFTQIFFNPMVTTNVLKIYYASGYNTINDIPYQLQTAIETFTAMLFQGDRQGLLPNNVIQTNLVERLLSPYSNL